MNFRKILSEFGSWIFAGLTFLGFIIIYAGVGGLGNYQPAGEINWYFVAVGLVLLLPYLFYILKINRSIKKAYDESAERVNLLIKTGEVITVDLDKVEIQTNSYKKEISVGSGYQQRNEYVNVNQNVITMDIPYQNDHIRYKINIDMDPVKLKMHFALKEKTKLYIDPENPNNHYLDLSFLNS